jgi:formate dehydrogenase beta subunit
LATNIEGVYAGGDVVTGPASVIEAIAAGRKAASSIDKYLGGDGIIDEELIPKEKPNPWLGRDDGFAHWARVAMPSLPVEQRLNGFEEVELGFDKEASIDEAKRCLQCHLRLEISPVTLPVEAKPSTAESYK